MPSLFNIKTRSGQIAVLLTLFAFGTSCSEELEVENFQMDDRIGFNVSVSDKWNIGKTRSAEETGKIVTSEKIENSDLWLITTVEDNCDTTLFNSPKVQTRAYERTEENFYDSFGVYAYVYSEDAEWNAEGTERQLYIDKGEVTCEGTLWGFNPPRYWPGAAFNMKFFAYAPYADDNENPREINETDGTPVITYTTNINARNQQDLLATRDMVEVAGNYNQPLGLTFQHILTAIDVKASDPFKRKITKITFSGVGNYGTYKQGDTEWENLSGSEPISCSNVDKELGGTIDYVISDADKTTFMMIPQTLGTDARITVEFEDSEPLSAMLSPDGNKKWEIGKRVTYTISDSGIEGTIDVQEDIIFDYTGGLGNLNVKSYVTYGTTQIPATWTAEFIDEKGSVINEGDEGYPYWLKNFPMSGEGSIETKTYSVEANQQLVDNEHTAWLQSDERGYKGLNKPHDLSTEGDKRSRTTANCYIVNGPGKYSFPLVYGNAFEDGIKNETAYKFNQNTNSDSHIIRTLINHTGSTITSPWIADNEGCTPDHAALLWQDARDLLTEVQFNEGNSASEHLITFNVERETIQEGNAVIAIYDSEGKILWSWHIWVTSYVPKLSKTINSTYDPEGLMRDKKVTNYDDNEYIFMGPPLGWCYGGNYKEREVQVRFRQPYAEEPKVIKIRQTGGTIGNNAPYYQWGRKDPMIPSDGNKENPQNKYYYQLDGTRSDRLQIESWTTGNECIKKGILNPMTFNKQKTMDNAYFDLWDMSETQGYDAGEYKVTDVIKTVYDPSPAHYKVPSCAAFSGFIASETHSKEDYTFLSGECNSPYKDKQEFNANNGCYFFCNPKKDKTGGLIYFPALGCRTILQGKEGTISKNLVLCEMSTSYGVVGSELTGKVLKVVETGISGYGFGQDRGTGGTVRPVVY